MSIWNERRLNVSNTVLDTVNEQVPEFIIKGMFLVGRTPDGKPVLVWTPEVRNVSMDMVVFPYTQVILSVERLAVSEMDGPLMRALQEMLAGFNPDSTVARSA